MSEASFSKSPPALRPKVRIGMPVLNGASTISRALMSLQHQTFRNIEILVTDNGSTDSTARIVRNFAQSDSRIRLVSFPRSTAGDSFRRSLENAETPFFMWAADDDYWHPQFIEKCLAAMSDSFSFVWPNWWTGDLETFDGVASASHQFHFVEAADSRLRTLSFINCNFNTHKCNIVYSLFRTEFLQAVWGQSNTEHDGAMGALICKSSAGKVIDQVLFCKQHVAGSQKIPFIDTPLHKWRRRKFLESFFHTSKQKSLDSHLELFPEFKTEIERIYAEWNQESVHSIYSRSLQIDIDES
jgi:glycosyltransferase involved in cell wall biosynthesis